MDLSVWVGMTLALAGGIALGQGTNDPANLAGERVRPSVTEDPIPANQGALALQQSLHQAAHAGKPDDDCGASG